MTVLTDSHSGNEPGRGTTKFFITFVVTPALLSFPLLISALHLTPKLMPLNLTRELMKELETIKQLRDQTSGMCY